MCAWLALSASALSAQQPARVQVVTDSTEKVRLSGVIGTFLVDAGVRTRGLPWTTGSDLPVKWETPAAVVSTDPYALQRGMTRVRTGTFMGTIGDSVALSMALTLNGNDVGLQRVMIHVPSMEVTYTDGSGFIATREMIESSLRGEGMTLQPLKCSRETEGASYGNLIDAAVMPGKTASGLWWFWQSPMQMPEVTLTILYRRADMDEVECVGTGERDARDGNRVS